MIVMTNHVLEVISSLFEHQYKSYVIDEDVFSNHSARSLSSSCSLASQTLERAQQNMTKYWGDHSPKKIPHGKH